MDPYLAIALGILFADVIAMFIALLIVTVITMRNR